MEPGTLFLAFMAGIVSILSPCVLPLLPVVLGSAVAEHKAGPAALALGLAISFVVIGLFVATIGFELGLNEAVFRNLAAVLMIAFGIVLCSRQLQMQFATAAGPISSFAESRFGGFSAGGLQGQFGVGLLLGAVWSPCVGPTLGAASVLASQGKNLGAVALTMFAFGVGAGLPLLLLGFLSRGALMRFKVRMMSAGKGIKLVFGGLLVLVGSLILTGLDRRLETLLVQISPEWLTRFTTQF